MSLKGTGHFLKTLSVGSVHVTDHANIVFFAGVDMPMTAQL